MASKEGFGRDRGRFRRHRSGSGFIHHENEKKLKTDTAASDFVNSEVMKAFRDFRTELDKRNDCFERIVKLSRDITIESKRLIFLLHRVTGSDDKVAILKEASHKLQELRTAKFLPLAQELDGQDVYQFLRAYSPGLQEYIEAVVFYHYLAHDELASLDNIQADLTFTVQNTVSSWPAAPLIHHETCTSGSQPDGARHEQDCQAECEVLQPPAKKSATEVSDQPSDGPSPTVCSSTRTLTVHVPPVEYILGVADFTGELMRMSINCVGAGDLSTPKFVAAMMRTIYDAFITFGNIPRDLRQKIKVLRQSLQKVEMACYTLKVRGSEIPKHMLADVFTVASAGSTDMYGVDEQDGFYD